MSIRNIVVALVCIVCFSSSGFAQQKKAAKPVVQFGNLDPTVPMTHAQLLANTRLKCTLPGCKVTGFVITMLPAKKELMGPYTMIETDQVSDIAKTMLAKLDTGETRIFIDNIQLSIHGRDSTIKGYIYTSHH